MSCAPLPAIAAAVLAASAACQCLSRCRLPPSARSWRLLAMAYHAQVQAQLFAQPMPAAGPAAPVICPPRCPRPRTNRFTCLVVASKNSSCSTLMALRTSAARITAEILRLRGALRNGPDIHPILAQRAKHASADAGVVASCCRPPAPRWPGRFRGAAARCGRPLFRVRTPRPPPFGPGPASAAVHGHADGVLRGALSNENHVDALRSQRRKQPPREARNAHHAAAFQVQQSQLPMLEMPRTTSVIGAAAPLLPACRSRPGGQMCF